MPSRPTPATPGALKIGAALDGSEPLARLRDALRDSNARFEAVRPLLPPALVAHVRPGPVDAKGWSLLAANAGVAAKLRHLRPLLEDELRAAGWLAPTVRIKVLAG
jgi:hypothetical protein